MWRRQIKVSSRASTFKMAVRGSQLLRPSREKLQTMLFLLQIHGRHLHEIQVAWLWVVNALLLFKVSVALLQNCASVGPYVSYDRMDNLLFLIDFGVET